MQCDVTRCIICICNKSEYLDQERSYKNSTKEVILWFQVIFAMQSRKYWTKFRFIGTLRVFSFFKFSRKLKMKRRSTDSSFVLIFGCFFFFFFLKCPWYQNFYCMMWKSIWNCNTSYFILLRCNVLLMRYFSLNFLFCRLITSHSA